MNTKRVKQKMLQWKRGERLLKRVCSYNRSRSDINRFWRLAGPAARILTLRYMHWERSTWQPWEKRHAARRVDWN